MESTLVLVIVIALLDSTSMVPIALVPLATMLGGPRPFALACAFVAGIGLSYFAAGGALLLGLGQLFDALDAYFERAWFHPSRLELILQIVIGAILVVLAWWMVGRRSQAAQEERSAASSGAAFVLGNLVTVVGFPGAVPYFGAIDQILRADAGPIGSAILLAAYNIAFVAPLLLLIGVRAVFPAQSALVLDRVGVLVARWGSRLLVLLLTLLGAVMVVDGIGWFLGQPLIPVGSPPPGP
ncbi:MAG: GAP family protein [Pseudomonadota bacterium]